MEKKAIRKRPQVRKRRRIRYDRIIAVLLIFALAGYGIWRMIYTTTPEYAMEQLQTAIVSHDIDAIQKYCRINEITNYAYDDLTQSLAAHDDNLSESEKNASDNFYVQIKQQLIKDSMPFLLSYLQTGSWQQPGGDSMLKGRQLGLDYDYLIERSQFRNMSLVSLDGVDDNGDTTIARVTVKDDYTGKTFVLNLLMSKNDDDGWQIKRIMNYRDYLDFITPVHEEAIDEYVTATQDIIDRYNSILDNQQTDYRYMTYTGSSLLSDNQREKMAAYIKSDILPTLEQRQRELDSVPVNDGAQYLKALRTQETALSIESWQHYLTAMEQNSLAEVNTAKAFQTQAINIQDRIQDVLNSRAINAIRKTIS